MLVSETSASIAPILESLCGCSLLNHFSKVAIRVRASVASFHEMTFLGWFSWARILGKHSICQNSPPYVDRSTFQKGERHSKKWWFTPPFFKPFRGGKLISLYRRTFFWKKSMIFVSLDSGPAKSTPDRQSGTWRVSEPEEYQHFCFSCFSPLEVNVLRFHVPLIIHLAKSGLRGSEWA